MQNMQQKRGKIAFRCYTFYDLKVLKSCFKIKKWILTSKRRAEHPFAGQNTQQMESSKVETLIQGKQPRGGGGLLPKYHVKRKT